MDRILIIFWTAALIVFVAAEAATAGLTSIWFAAGALGGLICALLGAPLWLQVPVFVAVSAVMLVLTRPLAMKYINGRRQPTNADRNLGRTAVVTEAISNLEARGAVQLDGVIWTARSLSGEEIAVGQKVTVQEIQGVKLIVEPRD